jgi:hypothetical protein
MGRKRSNIVKGDFAPAEYDGMLDCITLGVKEIAVEQAGFNPPYAWVLASRVWPRDPGAQMEKLERMERAMLKHLAIYDARKDEKFCINCGEWRKHNRYSPDKRNHDGLHSWCKFCRAEHARGIYLNKRESQAA